MADEYSFHDKELHSPGEHLTSITPHDSNDLAFVTRGIYVGSAGDLAVIAAGDSSAVTLVGVAAGTILPIRASRIMSTNTTASSIVAIY